LGECRLPEPDDPIDNREREDGEEISNGEEEESEEEHTGCGVVHVL
jgi:hypothetical protein